MDKRREQQLIALIGRVANLEKAVSGFTYIQNANDVIKDTHIDWGTNPEQVSAADVPIADTGSIITANEVEGALQENRTAIDLNTDNRTNASRIYVTKDDVQSIPNATWTIVEYDDESYDNLGEYDNVTNYRFTAASAGYYLIVASLLSASVAWDSGEVFQIALFHNGYRVVDGFRSVADAAITVYKQSTLLTTRYLAAADYIDIRVNHNQGAAINIHTEASYNYFSVHMLSGI